MTTPQEIRERSDGALLLAELARVKAHFQLRAVAAVIGAPMPDLPEPLHSTGQSS